MINKIAKADIKGIVFALLAFVTILTGTLYMSISFLNDNDYTMQNDLTTLQGMANTSQTNDFGDYQTALDEDTNETDMGLWESAKKYIQNTIEDSMFGKALKAGDLVKDSVGVFGKFVSHISNYFGVPGWIVGMIQLALSIGIIFTIIFFFRGWQK